MDIDDEVQTVDLLTLDISRLNKTVIKSNSQNYLQSKNLLLK